MTDPIPEFPANFTRVWVRGRIIDLAAVTRGDDTIGLNTSPVTFTPSTRVLLDATTKQVISSAAPISVYPQGLDGYFEIQLPATDDPDLNPIGWTYRVVEPTGRQYDLDIPYDTPVIHNADDPLDGQAVIELVDVVPANGPNPGFVQLLQGRGITTMALDAGHLTVTFSDGNTQDLGELPVSSIRGATDYDDTTAPMDSQVLGWNSAEGKFKPITVETGSLDASAITSGTLNIARIPTMDAAHLPIGTTSGTVAAGNDSRMTNARTPTAHASTHYTGGTDALTPTNIGAANSTHTHAAGDLVSGTIAYARLPVAATVSLTDAATIATNASQGNLFRVTIAGNRTLAAPSSPTDGQMCTWEIMASGADRTLTLTTSTGGFDISDRCATTTTIRSGKKLSITATYSSSAQLWYVTNTSPVSQPVCAVLLNSDVVFSASPWPSGGLSVTPVTEWKSTAEVDTHSMYHYNSSGSTWIQIPFTGRWRVHVSTTWGAFGAFDPTKGVPLYTNILVDGTTMHSTGANWGTLLDSVFYDSVMDHYVFTAGQKITLSFWERYGPDYTLASGPGTSWTVTYLGSN